MSQNHKYILVDADVLSHFMMSGNILIFSKIFPNKKVVLEIVADEIRRHPKLKVYMNQLIQLKQITEIPLPQKPEILKEFASLKKTKGPGESACMAMARFSKDIIASNNWKDIKAYCEIHQIEYLSTMDFIYEAYQSKILSLAKCDLMIHNLITAKQPAKLPCKNLEEYCKKNGLTF
jgi:predicted nucleic acid-binding protein